MSRFLVLDSREDVVLIFQDRTEQQFSRSRQDIAVTNFFIFEIYVVLVKVHFTLLYEYMKNCCVYMTALSFLIMIWCIVNNNMKKSYEKIGPSALYWSRKEKKSAVPHIPIKLLI